MSNYPVNYNNEYARPYEEDEISLVDIAKIIVKRWKWSVGVFILCMALGVGAVFLRGFAGVPVDYTSIYRVAENAPGSPIISLKATGEKTELYYIGLVIQNFIEQKKVEELPFKIEVETSDPSGFVVIKSSSVEGDNETLNQIKDVHKELVDIIAKEESVFINHKKEITERNLKNAREALDMLKTAQSLNAVELSAKYMDQIVSFENALDGLRPGELLQLAYGNKPDSKKRLFLVLIAFSSFFIAFITPFFVEFGANLRQSLKEDKEKK
jgi:hypothetical protein